MYCHSPITRLVNFVPDSVDESHGQLDIAAGNASLVLASSHAKKPSHKFEGTAASSQNEFVILQDRQRGTCSLLPLTSLCTLKFLREKAPKAAATTEDDQDLLQLEKDLLEDFK